MMSKSTTFEVKKSKSRKRGGAKSEDRDSNTKVVRQEEAAAATVATPNSSSSVANNSAEEVSESSVRKRKSRRGRTRKSNENENSQVTQNVSANEDKDDPQNVRAKMEKEENENEEGGRGRTVKSEEKKKEPSKRQVKRDKLLQKEMNMIEASKLDAAKKALNYVSKWKHAKSEWKFEKLRQVWLMDHLLDDKLIPDDMFPTVLEYFEGCIGMARALLLKKGMDVIRKAEENAGNAEQVTKTVEYNRARQLLQALPTEN